MIMKPKLRWRHQNWLGQTRHMQPHTIIRIQQLNPNLEMSRIFGMVGRGQGYEAKCEPPPPPLPCRQSRLSGARKAGTEQKMKLSFSVVEQKQAEFV